MLGTGLVCVLSLAVLEMAPPEGGPADAQLAEYAMAGLKASRVSIRSGTFHAVHRQTGSHREQGAVVVEADIFCAFEQDYEFLRFDREEQTQRTINEKTVEHERGGRYVRTPEKSMHASLLGRESAVSIMPPDYATVLDPFDVRCIGLAMPQEFGMPFDELFDLVARQHTLLQTAREGESTIRVAWVGGRRQEMKRTIWIDEAQGYAPVRFEFSSRGDDGWNPPRFVMHSTWQETNGAWVPATLRSEDIANKVVTEIAFTWESVNEDIDDTLFTTDGLDLQRGTYIADGRLEKPILIEIVGEELPPQARPVSRPDARRTWPRVFMAIAFAVLLVAVVVVLARWTRIRNRGA